MYEEDFEIKKCVYCGEDADTKDHVVPVSYYFNGKRTGRHLTADFGEENLVDCCRECNCMANNKVFDNIQAKREYIQERIKEKYKKVVNMPFWSDDEIKELGQTLRKEVKIQQLARKWILNRINFPVELYANISLNREIKRFLDKEL